MIPLKTLGLAIGIAFAASSFAVAQQGNPAANAAASGGSGTHQTAQKTGSAANTQKVIHNQNGYRRVASSPGRHFRHGRLFAYQPSSKCHMGRHMGRHMPRSCRM
jgi:hypothetical protein